MNIQVVAAPDGEPLWISWSLLGSVHDTRAARVCRIAERIRECTSAQLKNWDVPHRLRCCPHQAGEIARAVLVLHRREAG